MRQPYYADDQVTLYLGDCIDVLRKMPDASFDSVVTDPPYGLGFMGHKWDHLPPGRPWAEQCLRVLKPGGHLLAFGGTRTWHRLACAVEDAGFEIRDSIAWLYGNGFPKSLNLRDENGELSGWGTALKPAHEPIVMARKPPEATVAANVKLHGTGALNIDGCRVGSSGGGNICQGGELCACMTDGVTYSPTKHPVRRAGEFGRWPSNAVIDESQAQELDSRSETRRSPKHTPVLPNRTTTSGNLYGNGKGLPNADIEVFGYGDIGGAARFFYVAKADASERVRVNGITHPTVKPLNLMRWLARLVTPVSGTVLEPFAGSGTTVEACMMEGFKCIAIERETDYLPLIKQRIHRRRDPVAAVRGAGKDGGLFDLLSTLSIADDA